MEVTSYPHGTFSWIDLVTNDLDKAIAFYEALFGWTHTKEPAGPNDIYVMFRQDGKTVAGAMKNRDEGHPSYWASYMTVDNLEETVGKVAEAGGKVAMPGMDVMEAGRMAVVATPGNAFFHLWEPKNHIGSQIVNQPVSLTWNELMTRDLEGATTFMKSVFGWETQPNPNSTLENYHNFYHNDRMMAGVVAMPEEMAGSPMPNHWEVYVCVADADATFEKAIALGGFEVMAPFEIANTGRMAIFGDPTGAVINVIAYYEEENSQ